MTLTLTILGLVAVADASAPQALNVFNDKFHFIKQQLGWAVFGLILMGTSVVIPYKFWGKVAVWLFYANLLLLVAVLIPGVGMKVLGARRWLLLGQISIQPSEMIKFTAALYFARLAQNKKSILAWLLPMGLVAFLIMLQPDLGTTLIFLGVGFVQLFVSGVNPLYFLGTGLISGVLGWVVVYFSDYRRQRLLTFLKQTNDPLGSSYHIRQILLSLGLGGVWGVGLGASRQKYLFLPETTTDSIFAVIAEEIGFVGAVVIIILLLCLVWEGLKVAKRATDNFSKVFVVGVVAWIGWQVLLNVGSMVALVPLTGVPLPFFSYGGSSLTMILLSLGIVLNISRYGSDQKNGKRR